MTGIPATSNKARELAAREHLGLPDIATLTGLSAVEAARVLDVLDLRMPCSPHDLVSSLRRGGSAQVDLPRAFIVAVDRAAAVKGTPQEPGLLESAAPLSLDDEASIALLVELAGKGSTDAAWMLVDLAIVHFLQAGAADGQYPAHLGAAFFTSLRDIQARRGGVRKVRELAPALTALGVRRGRGNPQLSPRSGHYDPWQGVLELHETLRTDDALQSWIAGCIGSLYELRDEAGTNPQGLESAILPLGLIAEGGGSKADEMRALRLLAAEELLRRKGLSAAQARASIGTRLGVDADKILSGVRDSSTHEEALLMLSPNRRKGGSLDVRALDLARQGMDVPDGIEFEDLLKALDAGDEPAT